MLSIAAGRIVGSLLEKQRTTPDQYPLTLNALVLACNQSSSRDPVMALPTDEVDAALTQLKADGWLRFVHPSHGRSVTRYRQVTDERLSLDEAEAAVLALLLLRGPQTAGEMRTRSERMFAFSSVEQVERSVRSLAERPEPLVHLLERAPGQKEARWQQLVAEEAELVPGAAVGARTPITAPAGGLADRLAAVEVALTERIAALEARVQYLESQLGIDSEV